MIFQNIDIVRKKKQVLHFYLALGALDHGNKLIQSPFSSFTDLSSKIHIS